MKKSLLGLCLLNLACNNLSAMPKSQAEEDQEKLVIFHDTFKDVKYELKMLSKTEKTRVKTDKSDLSSNIAFGEAVSQIDSLQKDVRRFINRIKRRGESELSREATELLDNITKLKEESEYTPRVKLFQREQIESPDRLSEIDREIIEKRMIRRAEYPLNEDGPEELEKPEIEDLDDISELEKIARKILSRHMATKTYRKKPCETCNQYR